jgi:hypothetical protein
LLNHQYTRKSIVFSVDKKDWNKTHSIFEKQLKQKGYSKEHVTKYLPEQYRVCLTALDEIVKRAFEILETSDDNREKLQAMELFKDTHLLKMELLSNATTIDSASNYIRSKQQAQQYKKKLASDLPVDDDDNNCKDELTTTTAVF